jgi:hypothetical protein
MINHHHHHKHEFDFFYTIANGLDNFQNCVTINYQRNINSILATHLIITIIMTLLRKENKVQR